MVVPDPETCCETSSASEAAQLAALEAAAREVAHNARRRDIRGNVRSHRQRLRASGLRPVQFWLPDLRRADAREQARWQARAVAGSLATPPWSAPGPLETPEAQATLERGELRVLLTGAQPQIVAILLDNALVELTTTLVCPLTSELCQAPLLRVAIQPSAGNGLRVEHQLMLDALTTVPRQRLGGCLGRLNDADMKRLGLALLVVSGLAR